MKSISYKALVCAAILLPALVQAQGPFPFGHGPRDFGAIQADRNARRDQFFRDHGFGGFDTTVGQSGISGNPGFSGSGGSTGNSFGPATAASINPPTIDTHGGDGSAGGPGQDASQPSCFGFSGGQNVQLASGGDGGDAGIGGTGGNGGDIRLFVTNLTELKRVFVNASGGNPGATSSINGRGTLGCKCTQPVFTTFVPGPQVCRDVPGPEVAAPPPPPGQGPGRPGQPGGQPPGQRPPGQPGGQPPGQRPPGGTPPPAGPPQTHRVCEDGPPIRVDHFCFDGFDGSDGGFPQAGSGQPGNLKVTVSPTVLPPDAPSDSFSFGSIPLSVTLTKDNFVSQSGAIALFAAGSQLNDTFQVSTSRTKLPTDVNPASNIRTSTTDISTLPMTVSINGTVATASFDTTQAWMQTAMAFVGSDDVITINSAFSTADVAVLSKPSITGNLQNLLVTVTDGRALSDVIETTVHAKVESLGVFAHTRVDRDLTQPGDMAISAGQIVVNVGQIYPAANIANDLKPGKQIRVTLTVHRSLVGNGGQASQATGQFGQQSDLTLISDQSADKVKIQ